MVTACYETGHPPTGNILRTQRGHRIARRIDRQKLEPILQNRSGERDRLETKRGHFVNIKFSGWHRVSLISPVTLVARDA